MIKLDQPLHPRQVRSAVVVRKPNSVGVVVSRQLPQPPPALQIANRKYTGQQTPQRVFPCFLPTYPSTKSSVFCPSQSTPPLEEPERKVDRRDTTTPAPLWLRPIMMNHSPPNVTRLMVCNWQCWRRWWQRTRHDHSHTIGVSNNHSTPNLTRVKWRDWQCWWRWWQHTVTHCCGRTLRSALARLEH